MKKLTLKNAIKQEAPNSSNFENKEQFINHIVNTYPYLVGRSKNSYNYYISQEGIKFGPDRSKLVNTIIPTKSSNFDIVTIESDDITDDDIRTYMTNTYFDKIASNYLGIMGKTQYEVSAKAGVGKTTLLTQIGYYLLKNNDNFSMLFISDEMSESDWKVEVHGNPTLSGLPVVFMNNYVNDEFDYKAIVEKALMSAKYIILDSMSSIAKRLVTVAGMKPTKAKDWLRNKMIEASEKNNSIIMGIKHMTTDGKTKGGTEDKHMFTGKLSLVKEDARNRYVYFEKNRRGGNVQNKRLYFKKAKDGTIYFDEHKFDEDVEFDALVKDNDEQREKDTNAFNDLFKEKIKDSMKELETA